MRKVDWLEYAIGSLGGPVEAADQLGISTQTIYRWLDGGLGKISFGNVVRLAKATNTPLEFLGQRLGPHKTAVLSIDEFSQRYNLESKSVMKWIAAGTLNGSNGLVIQSSGEYEIDTEIFEQAFSSHQTV